MSGKQKKLMVEYLKHIPLFAWYESIFLQDNFVREALLTSLQLRSFQKR